MREKIVTRRKEKIKMESEEPNMTTEFTNDMQPKLRAGQVTLRELPWRYVCVRPHQGKIKDEEIVESKGWIMTLKERGEMRLKSNMRMPTYGNCDRCAFSGPVGKRCKNCDEPKRYYKVFRWHHTWMVNARKISEYYNAGHEDAVGDRIYRHNNDGHLVEWMGGDINPEGMWLYEMKKRTGKKMNRDEGRMYNIELGGKIKDEIRAEEERTK